jgi:hypothetical protein
MFSVIPRDRVAAEWPAILGLIGAAIKHDKNATPTDVRRWLTTGRAEAFWIRTPRVIGLAVTTTEGRVCWLNYAGGKVSGGPRAFVMAVRAIVAEIERLATLAGCSELRLGGRNWSRVFPDWERFDPDYPNRIRKAI